MNPEAIEAAAKAIFGDNPFNDEDGLWEVPSIQDHYRSIARAALEASAPYLIQEEALKDMRSMPWFEDLVMAEALAYHSGGNCRFETEARAAELEAAAEQFDTRTETLLKTMQNMVGHPDTEPGDVARYGAYSAASQTTAHWLRARAAAIRAGGA